MLVKPKKALRKRLREDAKSGIILLMSIDRGVKSSDFRGPLLLPFVAALLWAAPAGADFGRQRGDTPRPRAQPPSEWSPAVASQFFPDAFAELEGPRPDFSAMARSAASSAAQNDTDGSTAGGATNAWASLVSGDTLVDEIKTMKLLVDKILSKKRDFTGGGYLEARNGFSSIAASFGVIAVYDGDVRWKESASRARDRFAAAAIECNQGNDKTFAVATQAAEDLAKLTSGGRLDGPVAKDVAWHRIAARPPLMWRLEQAETALAEVSASDATFAKQPERFVHEAEMVAMIGAFIQQAEFEFYDDDTYRGYASGMRDAAVQAAAATRKGDFAAARAALAEVRKSCVACHGDYR